MVAQLLRLILVLSLALLGGGLTPQEASGSAGGLAAAMAERRAFGLSTDATFVQGMLNARGDAGSATYGIPMTTEEFETFDLEGRAAFGIAVKSTVSPYLKGLPTYGGMYFDQADNGNLVVLVTERREDEMRQLNQLMPAGERGHRVIVVEHSYAQLVDGATRARDVLASLGIAPHLVAVDTFANRVRIALSPPDVAAASAQSADIERALGVGVLMVEGQAAVEQAQVCTGRRTCYGPMKAGAIVQRGSTTETECTMGFHVKVGTDEKFLTAGHCGYEGSNNWYHGPVGFLGAEHGTTYGQNGYDAMIVQMPDAQASNQIYGSGRKVVNWLWQDPGDVICISFGYSNKIDCGTIVDDWASWTGGKCGCTLWGATHRDTAGTGGDSGSPLYYGGNGGLDGYAMGINAVGLGGGLGGHSRIGNLLNTWGASMVNCC